MKPARSGTRLLPLFVLPAFFLVWPAAPAGAQVGVVRGHVMSSYNHERFGGVALTLTGTSSGFLRDAVTDAQGRYRFDNVPVGEWVLSADRHGYVRVDSVLMVRAGVYTEMNVEMTPPWVADLPPVQAGTRLDSIREFHSAPGFTALPPADFEDTSLLPLWYRRYVRSNLPGLADRGPQQYPVEEGEMLRWSLKNQNLKPGYAISLHVSEPTSDGPPPGGWNVNLTNQPSLQRETAIAADPSDPRFVVAAVNDIDGNPVALTTFRSSDGGCSWTSVPLPGREEAILSYDPSVAWGPDGTAWAAAIVRIQQPDGFPASQVQLYRSPSRGASWEYVATVSQGGGNDKEMMAVDPGPCIPGQACYEGHIYVAWTHATPAGIRFRYSADGGETWSPVTDLSTAGGMSPHIAVGPDGEVYVAWREGPGGFKVRTSTDGGGTFAAEVQVAAPKHHDFRMTIPASPDEKILSYPVLAVDRASTSPYRGRAYLLWMDLHEKGVTTSRFPGPGHTDIYFSLSGDRGLTWSTPKRIHDGASLSDEFNQWLAVDPTDASGRIHAVYYHTEPYASSDHDREAVRLRYVRSDDGGTTWAGDLEVATVPSDDTDDPDGGHYGHYAGLSAMGGTALPLWTDGRAGLPGERHQIFSATVRAGAMQTNDCPETRIEFDPLPPFRVKKERSVTIRGRVFKAGAPAPGEWLDVRPTAGDVVTVLTPVVRTDSDGRIEVQVRGERRGPGEITAQGMGTASSLSIRGYGVWAWWMWAIVALTGVVIAGLITWLLWRKTGPWSWKRWLLAIFLSLLFAALFTLLIWFFFGR